MGLTKTCLALFSLNTLLSLWRIDDLLNNKKLQVTLQLLVKITVSLYKNLPN